MASLDGAPMVARNGYPARQGEAPELAAGNADHDGATPDQLAADRAAVHVRVERARAGDPHAGGQPDHERLRPGAPLRQPQGDREPAPRALAETSEPGARDSVRPSSFQAFLAGRPS